MKDKSGIQRRIEEIENRIRDGYSEEIYDLISNWNGKEGVWFFKALKTRGVECLFEMAVELVNLKKELEE